MRELCRLLWLQGTASEPDRTHGPSVTPPPAGIRPAQAENADVEPCGGGQAPQREWSLCRRDHELDDALVDSLMISVDELDQDPV